MAYVEHVPAPTQWPEPVRLFVQDRQERTYRRLGIDLGLGTDAAMAYQKLTHRQMPLSHLNKKPNFMSQADKDAVSAIYQKYFSMDLPTPYEDPNRYPVMRMVFDIAVAGFPAEYRARIDPPPFLATLPSGETNASILVEPQTNSPVIFFEQGLFQYLYDVAVLVAWAVPPISEDEIKDDRLLARHRGPYTMPFQSSDAFSRSVYAYVTSGTPASGTSPVPVPPHNEYLCVFLLGQMRYFAMAHEIAHIALEHLDKPAEFRAAWEQEYEADALALHTVCRSSRSQGISWGASYWSCDLALTALHMLDHALCLMAFGGGAEWRSRTHPDAWSRRARLRAIASGAYEAAKPYRLSKALEWIGILFGLEPKRPDDLVTDPNTPYREEFIRRHAVALAGLLSDKSVHAAGELVGMTNALMERQAQFWTFPIVMAFQNGVRPSPLWANRISRNFRPYPKRQDHAKEGS